MLGLKLCFVVLLSIGCEYLAGVHSHGMMLEPPARNSLWRFDPTAPANYDDNGLYCGGFAVQWSAYGGKCGICGDSYGDKTPRAHELGGTYGKGTIVKNYNSGEDIEISIKITQNHKGKFVFQVCNLDIMLESEECFKPLKIASGGYEHILNSDENRFYNVSVTLPADIMSKHSVVRWQYLTGNSWGTCEDGTGAIGCGPQERFVNCADVSIL